MSIQKLPNFILPLLVYVFTLGFSTAQTKYEPNESSLNTHNTPEWFKDAKFGIYTHWGPISNSLEGSDPKKFYRGWHGMFMYKDGVVVETKNGKPSNNFEHHVAKYGHPSKNGYVEVIEEFNPSKFDAEVWADLFEASGAKFAGPVAMHHDNFAMWDSKATRWNSMNYGGIDPSADLKRAIEARDIKFMASFHHAFTWKYFAPAHAHGGIKKKDYDLYTSPHSIDSDTPDQRFYDEWWAKLKEYIDVYQPDLLWFDWWLENLDEATRFKFLSYYYNKAEEWGKEVGVCYKESTYTEDMAIKDYERGRPNQPKDMTWLTDTSPGAWFYRAGAKFKKPNDIIDILIDIVAKNGIMLLNVPPNPDGTIPSEMDYLLREMGSWLAVNGEAIYGTRPWTVFGEGPTRLPEGGHKVEKIKIEYTANDVRYTKKSDKEFYALVMDTPKDKLVLKTLSAYLGVLNSEIIDIQLLGSNETIFWKRTEEGLVIDIPESFPTDYAHAFKIKLKGYTENDIGGNVNAHVD
ncbi:MAG: alpha-L-fucosidase [Bacteroidota bacterium]